MEQAIARFRANQFAFFTSCLTTFDVLEEKFVSPSYAAVIGVSPTFKVEISNVAEPLANDPVPRTVAPFMKVTARIHTLLGLL